MKNGVLIWITFLASIAFSGVQTVGRGGGFAEMQAYAIDRSLPILLSNCLKPENYCNLSTEEIQIVTKLSQAVKNSASELIQINPACEPHFIHRHESGKVSLDSCKLYTKKDSVTGPLPIPYQQIGQEVLRVRILESNPEISDTSLESLLPKLTVSFQFEDKQSLVPVKNDQYRMHLWSASIANVKTQFLTFETFKASHDLTEGLNQALCSTGKPKFSLGEFQYLESELGATGKADISWSCGSEEYKAVVYLDLTFEKDELKEASFSLFQKERL